MKYYYHLSVAFYLSNNSQAVDNALNDPNGNWLRYNNNSWIIYTDKTPLQLTAIVNNVLLPNDQYLIVKLERGVGVGRLPQWVWNWINTQRA